MKNYTKSDYAANKYSEGIVYRFADGTKKVITLADYLADEPNGTAEDFAELKKMSDDDYLTQVRKDNAQTKKNVSWGELDETDFVAVPSPEDDYIREIDETGRNLYRTEVANRVLDKMTDVQRRRYIMHRANKMTTRGIAEKEGVSHIAVVYSLELAEKKIQKVLAEE